MKINNAPRVILCLTILLCGLLSYAQVGINTKNPLGVFHIDPKGDTGGTALSPTNDSDDFIVTSNGYVGIGTANPKANLHIEEGASTPALRIDDGKQKYFKVLTAVDTNGNAEWKDQLLFKGRSMNGKGSFLTDYQNLAAGLDYVLPTVGSINKPIITITEAGLYSFDIRFCAKVNASFVVNGTPGTGIGTTVVHILINTSPDGNQANVLDQYEGYATTGGRQEYVTFTLVHDKIHKYPDFQFI